MCTGLILRRILKAVEAGHTVSILMFLVAECARKDVGERQVSILMFLVAGAQVSILMLPGSAETPAWIERTHHMLCNI